MRPEATVIVGLLAVVTAAANAQQPSVPSDSLAAQARQAANQFQPVSPEAVTVARADVGRALAELDAFFRTGAAYKAVGWKRYLRWDELVALTKSEQPPANETMSALIGKLEADQGGLELPIFVRLREALENYRAVAAASADGRAADEYDKRMEDLAVQLDAYASNPANSDAALGIGRTLGWLEARRQAPQVVSTIRQRYGFPNLLGRASYRLAAVGMERDIDQLTPVRDNILGTDLHGTARMVGHSTLSLDDDPDEARINVLLGGTAWSNNVGYNGPVTIHSTGTTSISARKHILLNRDGFFTYGAQASCGTRSNINDISARCGLIERVAWKRAGQQKGQAEAIASQHAAGRVAGQMNAEVGEQLVEANDRFQRARSQLIRRGEFPEDLTFSSKPDRIQLRMLQVGPDSLGAPNEPPGFAEGHDLAVRAHESSIINSASGLLGGVELTDVRLEKLILEDLKTDLPDELRVTLPDGTLDPDKEPWSIIFARELPVRVKFQDGKLWAAIRADGFTRGEGDEPGKYRPALNELVEISATYNVERTDQGATLRRDGDVQVRFPGRANPDQITVRDSPIVTFIRRKFRSMFKEEFVGEGLKLKGAWSAAGTLALKDLRLDGGWLVAGWQMPEVAPATVGAE
jgi:hypothetical protein